MRLSAVTLPVPDVSDAVSFFGGILGLPVESSDTAALVHVGPTCLRFQASSEARSSHHLAITIPVGKLAAGKAWLRDKTHLLSLSGQDEFEGRRAWNSRSVYFAGPHESVLELIERRELANSTPGPFSSSDLLCISEVGIAVEDVLGTSEILKTEAGVLPYGGPPAHDFAAVGDVHGLLILVSPGRPWLPTADRLVAAVPTSVTAYDGPTGRYPVGRVSTLEFEAAAPPPPPPPPPQIRSIQGS